MLQQKYIYIPFFLLLSLFTWAQSNCNIVIKGKVIDEHDNEKLAFATIYIQELNKWAVSDTAGNYFIKDICEGDYTILSSHIACKEIKKKVSIKGDTIINFYPEHHTEELIEVVVKADKNEEDESQSKTELSESELQEIRGESLADALDKVNGVTTFKTGPSIGKTVIGGMHSSRIVTINNGVKQADQQWGREHMTQIDPFTADNIEVVKGAASIQYGSDAIGGVVIVKPDHLPYNKNTLNGNFYLIGATNGQQGTTALKLNGATKKIKGLAFNFSGSTTRAGDFRSANYMLTNTGIDQDAFSGTIGFRKHKFTNETYYSYFENELGILRSAHIGNTTDLNNAIESGTPIFIEDFSYNINNPKQQVEHQILRNKSSYIFPKVGKIEFDYALQLNNRKEFDIRRGGRSIIPAMDIDLTTQTFDVVFKQIPTKKVHGVYGVSYTYQKNKNIPGTGVSPLVPNYLSDNIGVFAIEHFEIDSIKFEAGIRYDRMHYSFVPVEVANNNYEIFSHLYNNVSASLGARFFVKKHSVFRTNISTAFKAPTINELYSNGLHHASAAIEIGDNSLVSERAIKFINTLESNLGKKVKTEVTAYYNYIHNYTYLQPDGFTLTIRGAFPEFKYKQTTARFIGIDASIVAQLYKNIECRTQISYLNARDVKDNANLIGIPANTINNRLSYKIDNLVKKNSLTVAIIHKGVARQHLYPSFEIVNPPAGFNLFGFNLNYSIPFTQKTKLNIGVNAENIFNKEYRDYLNQFRYFAADLGSNYKVNINLNF